MVIDVYRLLLDAVDEQAVAAGFDPEVILSGPLDSALSAVLAEEVEVVMREFLSEMATHSNATDCSLRVAVADQAVTVTAIDGAHVTVADRAANIAKLRRRMGKHRGTMELIFHSRGTQLRWTAPLDARPPTAAV